MVHLSVSTSVCIRSSFKKERRLGAVFPLQVESVGEMVLAPQEGVEIIRHQQDLRAKHGSVSFGIRDSDWPSLPATDAKMIFFF